MHRLDNSVPSLDKWGVVSRRASKQTNPTQAKYADHKLDLYTGLVKAQITDNPIGQQDDAEIRKRWKRMMCPGDYWQEQLKDDVLFRQQMPIKARVSVYWHISANSHSYLYWILHWTS